MGPQRPTFRVKNHNLQCDRERLGCCEAAHACAAKAAKSGLHLSKNRVQRVQNGHFPLKFFWSISLTSCPPQETGLQVSRSNHPFLHVTLAESRLRSLWLRCHQSAAIMAPKAAELREFAGGSGGSVWPFCAETKTFIGKSHAGFAAVTCCLCFFLLRGCVWISTNRPCARSFCELAVATYMSPPDDKTVIKRVRDHAPG